MTKQTSKNVWKRGTAKLRYYPNNSEFAGGNEGGDAVPYGRFVLTDGDVKRTEDVYSGYEHAAVVKSFTESGKLPSYDDEFCTM